jgi:hypothetical protein
MQVTVDVTPNGRGDAVTDVCGEFSNGHGGMSKQEVT